MGRVLPKGKIDRLSFLRSHVPVWIANAAELGLDAATVANLSATLAAAEAAHLEQVAKQSAARAATQDFDDSIDRATRLASSVIVRIKAASRATDSLEPYTIGQVPAPKVPVRAPQAPPRPQIDSMTMSHGALNIKWKGSLTDTDFFTLYRIGPDRSRVHLASLRALSYQDVSVPLDQGDVSYFVVAHRRGIEVQSSAVAFMVPRQMQRAA